MNSKLSTKKKVLIAVPTIAITCGFLTACWFFLEENVFVVVLVSFFILACLFEYFAKIYEKRKKRKPPTDGKGGRP